METVEVDPLTEFFSAIKNPVTKDRYEKRLDLFFRWLKLTGGMKDEAKAFASKATKDPTWATFRINEYMQMQKVRAEAKEIQESTLPNYYKPIKLFCEENDITLNWKKISRRIPKGRAVADDRTPSVEEIKKILEYPDRRIRPAVLMMVSGGIRIGAWDHLKWKHVEPAERKGEVVAAKLKVYAGANEEYQTFITPEAYHSVKGWMDFRAGQGENITGESWVMRDLWDTTSRAKRGFVTRPNQLKSSGLKRLVERALWAQGVRKELPKGKRRHEFQADHGFRKFFKTVCENAGVKSLHVEMLMGHGVGLSENYYRDDEKKQLLDSYLKAVPELTILEKSVRQVVENEDIEELRKEVLDTRKKLAGMQATLNTVIEAMIAQEEARSGGKVIIEAPKDNRDKKAAERFLTELVKRKAKRAEDVGKGHV